MGQEVKHENTPHFVRLLHTCGDWCNNEVIAATKNSHLLSKRILRTGDGIDFSLKLCGLVLSGAYGFLEEHVEVEL